MDEINFKSQAEKEFWEKVYIAAVQAAETVEMSMVAADTAIRGRRLRMVDLLRGPKAA